MTLYIKCINCGHGNNLRLDDLLGHYAVCAVCGRLVKVVETRQDDSAGSDSRRGSKNNTENSA